MGKIFIVNEDGTGLYALETNPTRSASGAHDLHWSPDGRRLVFVGSGGLTFINDDGSGEQWIHGVYGDHPSWSPDGQTIAFFSTRDSNPGQIYTIGVDGHGLRRLTRFFEGAFAPVWSPDGSKIAFLRGDGMHDHWLCVMNADGSHPVQLTKLTDERDNRPAWLPDGKTLMFSSSIGNNPYHLFTIKADGSNRTAINDPDLFACRLPSWGTSDHEFICTTGPRAALSVIEWPGLKVTELKRPDGKLVWSWPGADFVDRSLCHLEHDFLACPGGQKYGAYDPYPDVSFALGPPSSR